MMNLSNQHRPRRVFSPFVLSLGLAGAALFALACSKPAETAPQPSEPSTEAPAGTPTGEEPAAGKRKAFSAMNHDERIGYMKNTVMPEMKELWASAGLATDNFNCKTCHGAGALNGSFEMPNADLPKLDASDGFADEKKEHPEAVKFMMEQVVPKMAALVDEEPYNPETHKGFGCFECHTMADTQ